MTKVAAKPVDTAKVDAALEAVKVACSLRGVEVARIEGTAAQCLGVRISGAARTWPVYVDCNEEHLRLPTVWTAPTPTPTPLAHISYDGGRRVGLGVRVPQPEVGRCPFLLQPTLARDDLVSG